MLSYLKKISGTIDYQSLEKYKTEKESLLINPVYNKYRKSLDLMPSVDNLQFDFSKPDVTVQSTSVSKDNIEKIEEALKLMIPWRKGPFNIFDIQLDAEWRSDHKWQRISPYVGELQNKVILDVGCNNGYFLYKMAEHNPKLALGIDPVPHVYFQHKLLSKVFPLPNVKFEMFGIDQIKYFENVFDTIFHMGIIYHHRHPIKQLQDSKRALKIGGKLILETIGIPGSESFALFPEDRYANMRNVWFVPTLSCLINWVKRAHFDNIEIISDTLLTSEEQRNTKWCPAPFQSLDAFLDKTDTTKTIEGLPAPRRFCIVAQKLKEDGI